MTGHVFKYPMMFPCAAGEPAIINIPMGSELCDIACQDDDIYLWAIVDIHAPIIARNFMAFGTGWKIDNAENLYFLKTVHMPNGLVWHIFEVKEL